MGSEFDEVIFNKIQKLENIIDNNVEEKIITETDKALENILNNSKQKLNENVNTFKTTVDDYIEKSINDLKEKNKNDILFTYNEEFEEFITNKFNEILTGSLQQILNSSLNKTKNEFNFGVIIQEYRDRLQEVTLEFNTGKLNTINTTNLQNEINDKIIGYKNTVNSFKLQVDTYMTTITSGDSIKEQVYDYFQIINNRLTDIENIIEEKDSTLDINLIINNLRNDIDSSKKVAIENIYSLLNAQIGQIDSFKISTLNKIKDLEDSLEDFTELVANDLRNQFTEQKKYVNKGNVIGGDDIIQNTIKNVRERKIERLLALNFINPDDDNNMSFFCSYNSSISELEMKIKYNVVTDIENYFLKYNSIDSNYSGEQNVRNIPSANQFKYEKKILNNKISGNILLSDFIYIMQSKKINSNRDTKESGIEFDSIMHLDVEVVYDDKSTKKQMYEIYGIKNINVDDDDDSNKYLVLKFFATRLIFQDMQYLKQDNLTTDFINKIKTNSYNNLSVSNLLCNFYIEQKSEYNVFDEIFKSENINIYNSILSDTNDISQNFFNNVILDYLDNKIISSDILIPLFNSNKSMLKNDLISVLSDDLHKQLTGNNSDLILITFWILYFSSIYDITINFNILNQVYQVNQLSLNKNGYMILPDTIINIDNIGYALRYNNKVYYITEIVSISNQSMNSKKVYLSNSKNTNSSTTDFTTEIIQNTTEIEIFKNPAGVAETSDILDLFAYCLNIGNINKINNEFIEYIIQEYNESFNFNFDINNFII